MKEGRKINTEIITWIVRIIVGGTFTVSGFVKAVDPWGLLYKSDDYLAALSLNVWPNLQLVGVFGLSAVEFLVGIFLLFGCFRRSVAIAVAVIMAFMLPLSLWVAVTNPVEDCGCFGDAFIISNWGSFWKNVFLIIGVWWLIKYNKNTKWLITPALQWLVFLVTGVFIVIIEMFGYISQPLLDFRPYKIGKTLIDTELIPDTDEKYVFVYEKDGVRKEVDEDDVLPDEDDGWVFIDRKEIKQTGSSVNNRDENGRRNLRIWSRNGEEDVTDEVISENGKELIVMMPNLKEVSPAITWKLNSLFEWSEKHQVVMIGVVSGLSSEISSWEDLSMASYPIYTADDTQIKEVVRGNPGVVYLIDGKVIWKSTLTALNVDDFMSPEISDDAGSFSIDNELILKNCIYMYVIIMGLLVVLSFSQKLKAYYFKKTKKNLEDLSIHDDMVHHEE